MKRVITLTITDQDTADLAVVILDDMKLGMEYEDFDDKWALSSAERDDVALREMDDGEQWADLLERAGVHQCDYCGDFFMEKHLVEVLDEDECSLWVCGTHCGNYGEYKLEDDDEQ